MQISYITTEMVALPLLSNDSLIYIPNYNKVLKNWPHKVQRTIYKPDYVDYTIFKTVSKDKNKNI